MIDANELRTEAAQTWFGYGRWSAPYWFIGMEPGGDDHPEIYTSWKICGGGPFIDLKQHEVEWNARVSDELKTHYFAEKPEIQTGTWQPLIHLLLGFTGSNEDAHWYQHEKWGRSDGETALIELSAIAAKSFAVSAAREEYRSQRIDAIRERLEGQNPPPQLAIFYATTYTEYYERIAGGPFEDGVRFNGSTLCALITHPARPKHSYEYWTEFGRKLRGAADAHRAKSA